MYTSASFRTRTLFAKVKNVNCLNFRIKITGSYFKIWNTPGELLKTDQTIYWCHLNSQRICGVMPPTPPSEGIHLVTAVIKRE